MVALPFPCVKKASSSRVLLVPEARSGMADTSSRRVDLSSVSESRPWSTCLLNTSASQGRGLADPVGGKAINTHPQ
jgi:hypothetical protein